MASRREFLQATLAASALPLMTGAIAPFAGAQGGNGAIYKAVYDERFASAREFAGHMHAGGIDTHAIKGDITDLWFNDLHNAWSRSKSTVVGVTVPSALFCLERLAWDYQMRVAFLGEHRGEGATFTHRLSTSRTRSIDELNHAGARWPERLARLLASQPNTATLAGATSIGLRKASGDAATTLYSWVIAPKRTALIA